MWVCLEPSNDSPHTAAAFPIRGRLRSTRANYWQETEAADTARRAFLSPIIDQCERVRLARKGRRVARDVDPATGEEIASDDESTEAA